MKDVKLPVGSLWRRDKIDDKRMFIILERYSRMRLIARKEFFGVTIEKFDAENVFSSIIKCFGYRRLV